MNERRIKKATIGRSGDRYYNKGFNLEILDESGREHRLYGSPEEMFDLGRKILQALPNSFTQQTQSLLSGKDWNRVQAARNQPQSEHGTSQRKSVKGLLAISSLAYLAV